MLRWALIFVAAVAVVPYGCGPIYQFPVPAPFSGATLRNPYERLGSSWQRANLHAHGHAWGGLTSGRQSSEAVASAYRSMGYSVPGVSNYHRIAALDGVRTLPIYEHGYNIGKRHQLAIGARRVDWLDFPLWQTLSQQQFVINRVAATAALVALAHPTTRYGYSENDLKWLTGYQLLEVVNGTHQSEVPWDAALSNGHAVWGLANDDTHDLDDPQRTAVAWNMINAPSASTGDIVEALRAGRSYAVLQTRTGASAMETVLAAVEVRGDSLFVTCTGEPSTFTFIGQNGVVRKTVEHVMAASYTFDSSDTYIRSVIRSPDVTMYLNPIFRDGDGGAPAPAAAIDLPATWLLRGSFVFASLFAFALYRKRRLRGPVPVPQVLRDARRHTA